MKKKNLFYILIYCIVCMLFTLTACSGGNTPSGNNSTETPPEQTSSIDTSKPEAVGDAVIILNMNGTDVRAKLYDNTAARSFKEMLPFSVTVSRATDDLCGSVSEEITTNSEEDLYTWKIGEIGWFDGWFTILCDNEEGMPKRSRTIIGKIIDDDIAFVQSLDGTVNITITLEESNKLDTDKPDSATDNKEITAMFLYINGNKLEVTLEDNVAVTALVEMLKTEDIVYTAHDYGGFEKVGGIGCTLPTANVDMTTQSGDVVLYSGNQIVIFYGSNSWDYTKLGKINGYSNAELRTLLSAGSGEVQIRISLK